MLTDMFSDYFKQFLGLTAFTSTHFNKHKTEDIIQVDNRKK